MGKGANTNMMNTANTQPMPSGGKGGAVAPRGFSTGAVSTSLGPIPTNPDGTPAGVQPMPTSGPYTPYTGGPTPMNPPQQPQPMIPTLAPQPPAGKGGGLQSRRDFVNSDNDLNRIRGAQMELERKARQEALNRSYYDQPAAPADMTAADMNANMTAEGADPATAQPPLQFGDPGYMPTYNPPTMIPASRNPYDRPKMGQMDRLNAAYQDRMRKFDSGLSSPDSRQRLREYAEELKNRVHFNSPEAEQRFNNQFGLSEPDRPVMETPEQRTARLFSYISEPSDRFGPVDPKLDAEYDNFLRTRMNPNQVMNRFTGVRRAAFGEPLQISSAFGSPFRGLTAMGRERFNPALVNAPVGAGPRVNSGRGGKGDFGAYAPYVNI